MQSVNLHMVYELHTNFWDSINSSVFQLRTKRFEKVEKILVNSFNESNQSFTFMLDKNTEVCEGSYFAMLGRSNTYYNFRIPDPWIEARKILIE